MKKLIFLIILLFSGVCYAGEVVFDVTWDDVGVDQYRVEVSEVSGDYTQAEVYNTGDTTYSITVEAEEGETVTRYIRVVSIDSQGLESFPSNEVSGSGSLIRPPSTIITEIKVEVRL